MTDTRYVLTGLGILIICAIISINYLDGTGYGNPDGPGNIDENVERIGGRYDLELVTEEVGHGTAAREITLMRYTRGNRTIIPDQTLPRSMRPGLDWLHRNTPPDAHVLSWWDYGHAIRAYGEREPVIDAPSRELLPVTVSKYLGMPADDIICPDCVPHALVRDVADALLAYDPADTRTVMKVHGAGYLYVHAEDAAKADAIFIAAGREPGPVKGTVLGDAFVGARIDGFWLVYSDPVTHIYELA
ncbi:MAG: hypothetical protein QGG26_08550 [Candidatus Undinarchaeales archaeon]|jgi:hypothetical protein|nr:hypothetical protein [Candidatus Undinarchaeales archaeon]